MTDEVNLVVLVSGFGSNLQAILDAAGSGMLPARVCAVISNKADAYGLERARLAGLPAIAHVFQKGQERADYDRQLAGLVASYHPDWVVLAGWMRILSAAFLECFPNRVVNLHPALPGTFPGTHAIERAYKAWQDHEIDRSGVMVHLVPDEGVDSGPVLAAQEILFAPNETLEQFEQRVHELEHSLLVAVLRKMIVGAGM